MNKNLNGNMVLLPQLKFQYFDFMNGLGLIILYATAKKLLFSDYSRETYWLVSVDTTPYTYRKYI